MSLRIGVSRRHVLAQAGATGLAVGLLGRSAALVSAQEASPGPSGELPPLLAAYAAAANAHDDGSQFASLVTDDAVWEDVPYGLVYTGPEEIAGYQMAQFTAFPDLLATFTSGFISGNMGATEWTYTATYTGQIPDLPPGAGQPVSFRGVDVLELEGDKVSYIRSYYDLFTLLTQLGLIPPPEDAATPAP